MPVHGFARVLDRLAGVGAVTPALTFTIWGPPAGSTCAVLARDGCGRVVMDLTTDFGATRGVFNIDGARQMRDALNVLLGEVGR